MELIVQAWQSGPLLPKIVTVVIVTSFIWFPALMWLLETDFGRD